MPLPERIGRGEKDREKGIKKSGKTGQKSKTILTMKHVYDKMIIHTVGVCGFHKLPPLWNYSSTYRCGCQ